MTGLKEIVEGAKDDHRKALEHAREEVAQGAAGTAEGAEEARRGERRHTQSLFEALNRIERESGKQGETE